MISQPSIMRKSCGERFDLIASDFMVPAGIPPAVDELKEEGVLSVAALLRRCKYLNNIVEQDHRFIKRRVNSGLGFFSFNTTRRTIGGYEIMNMIRKGQVEGIGKGGIRGQVRFVAELFEVAA